MNTYFVVDGESDIAHPVDPWVIFSDTIKLFVSVYGIIALMKEKKSCY
ncbi:hypothetical protein Back11_47920 [Paenibacillus baekrokdamisoli]|uniref:Uncharacterized protein n=1 Tax=Paenibacillus baekrokdamisoli TaxID=1712516 RepID=A0A3G9IX08_9BACL|nr:hypothetical protein Back11_47920 [Paenibacillus baekrokdamisoli]